jgi:hypothetical protein
MRYALGAILVLALGMTSMAEANQNFTVVLHARTPAGTGACTAPDLPDCVGVLPTTQITPATEFRLYIFVNNYTELFAFQTSFTWPADWSVDPDAEPPVVFGCRGNQLNASEPANPGGPLLGTIATAFDCFTGPGLAAIARIDFLSGATGCLIQTNPTQGTQMVEVLNCTNASTVLDATLPENAGRLGSICIGSNGVDACAGQAVEPSTWGGIKASYR